MSTRFTRTIRVKGEEIEIELVRDGFTVYRPEEGQPVFSARRVQQHFGGSQWEYFDDSSLPDCRAIFEFEDDVVDYMCWRIEKWMNTSVEP